MQGTEPFFYTYWVPVPENFLFFSARNFINQAVKLHACYVANKNRNFSIIILEH